MKECTKCHTVKDLSEYYADKQKADKKTSVCRSCINEKQALSRQNPLYIYQFNEYQKEWQRSYRVTPKYKEWRKMANSKHKLRKREAKQKIVAHYGGKCSCCGESNIWFLSIDHINNDGYKTRKGNKYRSYGLHYYDKIIEAGYPDDLQILCFNCNIAKNHNGGTCPHIINKQNAIVRNG